MLQGPNCTYRYEIEPAPGVKVSRIVNLTDDIALKFGSATYSYGGSQFQGNLPSVLRSLIKTTEAVHLRDVLDCSDFKRCSWRYLLAGLVRICR